MHTYTYSDSDNEVRITFVPNKSRVNVDVSSVDGDMICMDFSYGDVRELSEYLERVIKTINEEEEE